MVVDVVNADIERCGHKYFNGGDYVSIGGNAEQTVLNHGAYGMLSSQLVLGRLQHGTKAKLGIPIGLLVCTRKLPGVGER